MNTDEHGCEGKQRARADARPGALRWTGVASPLSTFNIHNSALAN
jgi:hypothetical protein